jgi:periplasmic protein TonB
MFESLQGSSARNAAGRFAALLFSMFLHALMITLLVVLPLVFLRVLPGGADLLTFLIAPPAGAEVHVAPPPKPPGTAVRATGGEKIRPDVNFDPALVQRGIPAPEPELPEVGIALGILGSGLNLAGTIGTGLNVSVGLTHAAPPAVVPPPPKPPRPPVVRVGGTVQDAKVIRRVVPVYPEISKRARISGVVILEVNIDEEGNVTDIRVVRGHVMLVEEAVSAVKQWKYSPTLLNGEPVAVVATVTVVFQLK